MSENNNCEPKYLPLLNNSGKRRNYFEEARNRNSNVGDNSAVYNLRKGIAKCTVKKIKELSNKKKTKKNEESLKRYTSMMRRLCKKKNACKKKHRNNFQNDPDLSEDEKNSIGELQDICGGKNLVKMSFCDDVTLKDALL